MTGDVPPTTGHVPVTSADVPAMIQDVPPTTGDVPPKTEVIVFGLGGREMDSPDRRPGCRTILRTRAPSVCCGQSSAGQRARHAFPTAHHGTLRREAILWAARPIRDNSYPTPWGRCGCFREGRDLNPSSFPAAWATWYQTYRSIDDAMTNPESNEARPTGGPTHGVRGLHVAGLLRCGT